MGPDRRGMALPGALVALVLLSTLAVAAHLATQVEARGASRAADGARALLAADAALTIAELAARRRALAPPEAVASGTAPPAVPPVGREWTVLDTLLAGVPVRVEALALAGGALLLAADARVSRGARVVARRAVHVALVPDASLPPFHAALLAAAALLADAATVDGHDAPPEGWDAACEAGADTAGVALPAGGTIAPGPGARVAGSPPQARVAPDAPGLAGDTAWARLARGAHVVLAPGATLSPAPALRDGVCAPGDANWGEPARGGGVVACAGHAPVVHARGDLAIDGDGRGQGILLVDGALRVTGRLDYAGIVVARGGISATGGLRVAGAVVATRAELAPGGGDAAVVRWSSCAVEAARASALRYVRAPGRAWLQRF